jgi:tight adherence protein C
MTALLVSLVVVLVAATAWLLARAARLPRLRMETHIQDIDQYGFEHDPVDHEITAAAKPPREGAINALMEGLGRLTASLIPGLRRIERGDLSAAAMYAVSPEAVHGFRALLAILLPGLVVISGLSFSLTTVLLLIIAPVIGWALPGVFIRQRGRARLDAIDRDLPRLIDVLIATIEAGMGFAASLQLLSRRFKGSLGAELRLMQREQGLGISTEQALENLQSRCDTPSVRAFSRSLLHAQELGVSIGPMLRNLAIDIRRRRRQTAREKVQKLPIKMLFPLALLIFPPLIIVILYPALYNILHSLGGS